MTAIGLALFLSLSWSSNGDLYFTLIFAMNIAAELLMIVWQARSAHDLAGPPARQPAARPVPVKVPLRWWPFAVAAIVLPLLPALPYLARGIPRWLEPFGPIDSFLSPSPGLVLLWLALNMLVGTGGMAVLVLITVIRRTRRLVRATITVLILAAGASALTYLDADERDFLAPNIRRYPDWLVSGETGTSPLWYSAAFAATALLLHLCTAPRRDAPASTSPRRRSPRQEHSSSFPPPTTQPAGPPPPTTAIHRTAPPPSSAWYATPTHCPP
ncbi:hypothetical protein Acor_24440 [Acrocarpospora corrugata]|uniref:Uncharacterized protein n=2 Tax=Acrocarpospora corrugata TaxID=35763 RepID=A0A5M3VWP7_9ACTN|nr:hypothetical protein Acor_24440 [Acrocarpospora corrugata]